ncbi:MAG: hypothetical protein WCK28_21980 [Burkholderiales bacterium]
MIVAALDAQREAGMRDGREAGLRDGRNAGLRDGRNAGLRDRLLRVLARRGIALDAAHRERVAACDDLATLDAWLDRAADAASADVVFADP